MNTAFVKRMRLIFGLRSAVRGESVAAIVFAAFALISAPGGFVDAAEVAGVQLDPRVHVAGTELELNGAGLRRRFMADVYVIGLYVVRPTSSAEAVIDTAGPKRIALTFMRDVTARALVDALYEGVRDNSTDTEFARLKRSADALSAIMLPLRIARRGDIVALDYVPHAGAQVVMNGRAIGRPVPGEDLYRALLRMWLGDSPVDAELKRALLSSRS